MTVWTEELKAEVVKEYRDADPTAETSAEIVKEIAERRELSPNGVRMVIVQSGHYIKKDATSSTSGKSSKTTKTGEATKRVSKESQIDELRNAIKALDAEVDEDILSKLTGKAAAYFSSILGKK
jgi:hypothetical protein